MTEHDLSLTARHTNKPQHDLQRWCAQLAYCPASPSTTHSCSCADQTATKVPVSQFRIIDSKTIQTATRQVTRPTQFYSNRAVERALPKGWGKTESLHQIQKRTFVRIE